MLGSKRARARLALLAVMVAGLAGLGAGSAGASPVVGMRATTAQGGVWSTPTGVYYQGHQVWTETSKSCMGEILLWNECQSFRVYFNSLSVWGAGHTLVGLHGAHACHTDGSNGYGFVLGRIWSCGEHNMTSDRLKIWYSWDECLSVGGTQQCNYRAQHVYVYANGAITGPYSGLGA